LFKNKLEAKMLRSLPLSAAAGPAATNPLKRTALYEMHKQFGGKLVPFAGWEMPVQYTDLGIGPSTLHTRQHASLFDVSHMLQSRLWGKSREEFIEYLTVADVSGLPLNNSTLSVFTNRMGGIVDDTIINKQPDHLYIVSNAGCADKDVQNIQTQLKQFLSKGGRDCTFEIIQDKSLLALQGKISICPIYPFHNRVVFGV
jgi:aminomethyltransferase